MHLENIGMGHITASMMYPDCRLLALACHAAAATCRGSELAPDNTARLPTDGTLAMLYEALAGAFEAAGLAAYQQGSMPVADTERITLVALRTGQLND